MSTHESQGRGGSFRELRSRHLPLFDPAVHRHDRGWPHPPPRRAEHAPQGADKPRRRAWKTVGIVHFPHSDAEEALEA